MVGVLDAAVDFGAFRALRQFGVCPLPEWPYDVAKFAVKPDPKCYEEALKHEVIGASQLQATVTAIKGGLAKGFPVVLGIQVYQSFESDGVARTGVIPEPNKSKEQCLGGHAICLAGYDDAKKAFILRNSWGSGWGLAGYAYLPYGYISDEHLASDPWIITSIETTAAPVAPVVHKAIPTRPI